MLELHFFNVRSNRGPKFPFKYLPKIYGKGAKFYNKSYMDYISSFKELNGNPIYIYKFCV